MLLGAEDGLSSLMLLDDSFLLEKFCAGESSKSVLLPLISLDFSF